VRHRLYIQPTSEEMSAAEAASANAFQHQQLQMQQQHQQQVQVMQQSHFQAQMHMQHQQQQQHQQAHQQQYQSTYYQNSPYHVPMSMQYVPASGSSLALQQSQMSRKYLGQIDYGAGLIGAFPGHSAAPGMSAPAQPQHLVGPYTPLNLQPNSAFTHTTASLPIMSMVSEHALHTLLRRLCEEAENWNAPHRSSSYSMWVAL
jgi:hypothetical protein